MENIIINSLSYHDENIYIFFQNARMQIDEEEEDDSVVLESLNKKLISVRLTIVILCSQEMLVYPLIIQYLSVTTPKEGSAFLHLRCRCYVS